MPDTRLFNQTWRVVRHSQVCSASSGIVDRSIPSLKSFAFIFHPKRDQRGSPQSYDNQDAVPSIAFRHPVYRPCGIVNRDSDR